MANTAYTNNAVKIVSIDVMSEPKHGKLVIDSSPLEGPAEPLIPMSQSRQVSYVPEKNFAGIDTFSVVFKTTLNGKPGQMPIAASIEVSP